MRHRLLLLAPLIGALAATGAETLTGRVVDGSANALAGARVWLKSRPDHFDSTGADGRFSLELSATSLGPSADPRAGAAVRWHGNRLAFYLASLQAVTLELQSLRGEKLATLFHGRMDRGRHSLAVDPGKPAAPSGSYVLVLKTGDASTFLPAVWTESGLFSQAPAAEAPGTAGSRAGLAKSAAADDTLIILRMGHEIRKSTLAGTATRDIGDISLKARSYRRDTAVAVKAGRRIEVYVPSDYKELYRLPVLYLVHGRGADETYWRVNCKFLDSLNTFADRLKMQPMIIVTPAAGGAVNVGHYGKTADPFMADLTVDIRAWVESRYKADTARMSRAISGLSMGAIQTWNLTCFYPDLWGYSLPMSGGLLLSVGFSDAKFRSDVAGKAIDVESINQIKLFKVYSNPSDIAYSDTDSTSRLAASAGISHTTDFTTRTIGGHTDPYWNEVFRKYAPLLFK